MELALITDMVTPTDRARVLASVKLSADYGRDLADLAALMFGPYALSEGQNGQVASPMKSPTAQGFQAKIMLPASPAFSSGLRAAFDAALSDGLPNIHDDWHDIPEEDRAYLAKVAAMVFDRRLAIHAAGGQFRGGQA